MNNTDDLEDLEPDLTIQERQQRIKVTNWTVHDIVQALDARAGIEIFIPSFQRGICWNRKKQQLLIKSIKRGFPIGSLLLYKESPTRYELVDGLQRATTLRGL